MRPEPSAVTPPGTALLWQRCAFAAGDVLFAAKEQRVLAADDSLIGKAKGAVQLAKERDIYKSKLSMKSPLKKGAASSGQHASGSNGAASAAADDDDADAAADADADEADRELDLSLVHVLGQQSDFQAELCALATEIDKVGSRCAPHP